VRRATTEADVEAVATLAAEVFGGFEFVRQPTSSDAEATTTTTTTTPKLLAALEQRRATLVADDVRARLSAALAQKREAQQTQRVLTLEGRARSLRAALEAARLGLSPQEVAAEAASRPRAETRAEVRERERRRRDRAFATLLAVADSTSVVGIATVSLRRPEAALPPPFPSSAPLRAYLSDMAVSPSARRRGAARLLLERACALARRWGEDSLWLHVAADNRAAVALYQSAGFESVKGGSGGAAVAAALAGLAAGGSGGGKQVLMVRRF
jgi:ribosomal protein S18 acetylase RimI-like enzyme